MQLTKYTHSCVRLDDGDQSVVIDPGVFKEVDTALDGAGAVLITHEHPDHIDTAKVTAALRGNPRLPCRSPRPASQRRWLSSVNRSSQWRRVTPLRRPGSRSARSGASTR